MPAPPTLLSLLDLIPGAIENIGRRLNCDDAISVGQVNPVWGRQIQKDVTVPGRFPESLCHPYLWRRERTLEPHLILTQPNVTRTAAIHAINTLISDANGTGVVIETDLDSGIMLKMGSPGKPLNLTTDLKYLTTGIGLLNTSPRLLFTPTHAFVCSYDRWMTVDRETGKAAQFSDFVPHIQTVRGEVMAFWSMRAGRAWIRVYIARLGDQGTFIHEPYTPIMVFQAARDQFMISHYHLYLIGDFLVVHWKYNQGYSKYELGGIKVINRLTGRYHCHRNFRGGLEILAQRYLLQNVINVTGSHIIPSEPRCFKNPVNGNAYFFNENTGRLLCMGPSELIRFAHSESHLAYCHQGDIAVKYRNLKTGKRRLVGQRNRKYQIVPLQIVANRYLVAFEDKESVDRLLAVDLNGARPRFRRLPAPWRDMMPRGFRIAQSGEGFFVVVQDDSGTVRFWRYSFKNWRYTGGKLD